YDQMQADLRGLLGHIDKIKTESDDRETRFLITEKPLHGNTAPTVSAGTARITAILGAYHALDMRLSRSPGLVVIEEPDTAIHPLLLENFVLLLRDYVSRDEHPRQVFMTTHNPHFLDYFQPEEVRVVERDEETGETWVDSLPGYLHETWLHKHSLGDAWTS